ncbi:MAG: MarR family transcriptional regulator [Bacteroidales bacterium]|jgi:DNA-binding MarR family transcriptional regulator|nr:MarR family transcriptional regulator [Bacteroidales bacterium]
MVSIEKVKEFREYLRHFEREIEIQNSSNCCCGVTLTQCHTLMELDKQDNVSLKKLAERLYQDKSTVSRIVEGLVSLGLVDRVIPQNNRRMILIILTKQGISVCKKINAGNNQYFQNVLNSIPQEQLLIFVDSFKTIVSKMSEANNKKTIC